MRVLIVDDEPRYRLYLGSRLESEGYEVAVAEDGRRAIDRGLGFRPQVLVTDWMLGGAINGIHVASTLRAVDPALPTILMTGFASDDLRSQADDTRVLQFLEKPFELDELAAAVDRARGFPRRRRRVVPFGVVVADQGGLIVHLSDRAGQMTSSTAAGLAARRLSDLFEARVLEALDGALDDRRNAWSLVAPIADKRVRWWVASRRSPEGRTLVLLPERKRFLREDPRVRMLLDLDRPSHIADPPRRDVLVVDGAALFRTSYLGEFERIGCVGYKADTPELALRLIDANAGIGIVVIDIATPGVDLPILVEAIRSRRPEVVIIGVSEQLRHEVDFATVGVDRFLQRPWRVGDMIQVLGE